MKKIILTALAVASISTVAFAADKKKQMSFTNELKSNIIDSWHWSDDNDDSIDSKTKLAAFYDNIVADYDGGVLKLGIDATIALSPYNYFNNKDDNYWTVEWDGAPDWYVEFAPWKMVALGFSDELYTNGSYLPVLGDNISGGNYSTNGVSLIVRPNSELTIAGGFDFKATFDGDDGGDPALCLGVDYSTDDFSVGATMRHITSDANRQIGIYGSLGSIDNLVLRGGFTHSKNLNVGLGDVDYANAFRYWNGTIWKAYDGSSGIYAKNLINAGVEYDASKFLLAADLAFSLDSDDSDYDLYTALDFLFGLDKAKKGLGLDIQGFLLYDLDDENKDDLGSTVGIKGQLIYSTGKHTLKGGLALQHKFDDDRSSKDNDYTYLAIPVSWKWEY